MIPPTTRLRELLDRDQVTLAPGAYDALTARLVQRAGFDAVYMTGSGTAQARYGVPDLGLLTATEMAANAASMADAIDVPLIADADTGYGSPLNVRRTVQEYERAGVAGLHLEDQVTPKKCGQFQGKQLVPADEHAMRIRAACEARRDRDLVIIARTDGLIVEGLESTLARAERYVEAGADMVFVEGPRDADDLRRIGERLDVPLLYNMTSSGKSPFLSTEELGRFGRFRIMIAPNYVLQAAIGAAQELLAQLHADGHVRGVLDRGVSWSGRQDAVDLPTYQELERRYGLSDDARTTYQNGVL